MKMPRIVNYYFNFSIKFRLALLSVCYTLCIIGVAVTDKISAHFQLIAMVVFILLGTLFAWLTIWSPMATPTRNRWGLPGTRNTPNGKFWIGKSLPGAWAEPTQLRSSGLWVSFSVITARFLWRVGSYLPESWPVTSATRSTPTSAVNISHTGLTLSRMRWRSDAVMSLISNPLEAIEVSAFLACSRATPR